MAGLEPTYSRSRPGMLGFPIDKVVPVESRSGDFPSTLANRYELSEVIGRGGMAVVWLAHDRQLRRRVAVKVLLARVSEDPSFQTRFQREARHIASMSHPNIARVFDCGTDGDASFIVMEYVEGRSLRQIFEYAPVLNVATTAELATGILAALEHAHQRGIVHRDMKPGNILVSSDGTVKVVDFGVAKSLGETTELTLHGSFVGTATYASPEQFTGQTVGPASDLYSLGCVLYRCLAGRPPFEADSVERLILQHRFAEAQPISALRSDVPESTTSAITRALDKDPARRFGRAEEMGEAFSPFAGTGLEALVSSAPTTHDGGRRLGPGVGVETTEVAATTRPIVIRNPVGDHHREPRRSPSWTSGPTRRRLGTAMVVLLVVLLIVGWRTSWHFGLDGGSTTGLRSELATGGFLRPGQSIASMNGRYLLAMQSDGNLVDYAKKDMHPLWASATSGNFGAYAVMQVDGDFVVYPTGRSAPAPGEPTPALWSSGTYGHPGSSVALQDDGATVVRERGSGVVLWSSSK